MIALAAPVTLAQPADVETMATIPVACQSITMASCSVACGPMLLVYMHYRRGLTMLSVSVPDGRAISFVGKHDTQPSPTSYTHYLARVRMAAGDRDLGVAAVSGSCTAEVTDDASSQRSVVCAGTDAAGRQYAARLAGIGPVSMSHPNG